MIFIISFKNMYSCVNNDVYEHSYKDLLYQMFILPTFNLSRITIWHSLYIAELLFATIF